MAEDLEFKFDIDLSPYGRVESFLNKDEFQKWLRVESDFWAWGDGYRDKDQQAFNFMNSINSKYINLQNTYNHVIRLENDPNTFRIILEQLKSQLSVYYKNKQLLHSSDPRSKAINDMRDKDIIRAVYMLKYYIPERSDRSFNFGDRNQFEGAFSALLFEAGVKGTSKAQELALEELQSKWQDNLNNSKKTLEDSMADSKSLLQAIRQQKDGETVTFNGMLSKSSSDFQALINEAQKSLKAIEHTYDKKLALHSSIKYWQGKFWIHVVSAGVLTIGVILSFYWAAKSIKESVHDLIGTETLSNVAAWKVGQVLLIATISVWVIRILIRLLLSQIHLWNDAIERRTMILTYLALLKEKGLPEESRDLILQTLFRPASTGILRDDGIPPFMAEWLKRTTGND